MVSKCDTIFFYVIVYDMTLGTLIAKLLIVGHKEGAVEGGENKTIQKKWYDMI